METRNYPRGCCPVVGCCDHVAHEHLVMTSQFCVRINSTKSDLVRHTCRAFPNCLNFTSTDWSSCKRPDCGRLTANKGPAKPYTGDFPEKTPEQKQEDLFFTARAVVTLKGWRAGTKEADAAAGACQGVDGAGGCLQPATHVVWVAEAPPFVSTPFMRERGGDDAPGTHCKACFDTIFRTYIGIFR